MDGMDIPVYQTYWASHSKSTTQRVVLDDKLVGYHLLPRRCGARVDLLENRASVEGATVTVTVTVQTAMGDQRYSCSMQGKMNERQIIYWGIKFSKRPEGSSVYRRRGSINTS